MTKNNDFSDRKERQAAEGKAAMAEYLSRVEQMKKLTAKLRQARLAREASEGLEKKPVKRKRR